LHRHSVSSNKNTGLQEAQNRQKDNVLWTTVLGLLRERNSHIGRWALPHDVGGQRRPLSSHCSCSLAREPLQLACDEPISKMAMGSNGSIPLSRLLPYHRVYPVASGASLAGPDLKRGTLELSPWSATSTRIWAVPCGLSHQSERLAKGSIEGTICCPAL